MSVYTVPIGSESLEVELFSQGLFVKSLKFCGRDFMLPLQRIDYGDIEKRRGTHLCMPVFGKPPKTSNLYGEIDQHGPFRNMIFNIEKLNESTAAAEFVLPQTEAYPWEIGGNVMFACYEGNTLVVKVFIKRGIDGIRSLAPVNVGFHNYWVNKDGASVSMKFFEDNLQRIIVPSHHVPYSGIIDMDLHGIGSVQTEMRGDLLSRPEVVLWTDHPSFVCVEPVMAHSKHFDDPENGVFLREEESFWLNLSMKFKVEK